MPSLHFFGGHGANRTNASMEASVSHFLLHRRTKELSSDTHAPVLNPTGSPTKPVPSTHAQSVALKFATADSFGTSSVHGSSSTHTSHPSHRFVVTSSIVGRPFRPTRGFLRRSLPPWPRFHEPRTGPSDGGCAVHHWILPLVEDDAHRARNTRVRRAASAMDAHQCSEDKP